MFIAAMADACPQHRSRVVQSIGCLESFSPVAVGFASPRDDVLSGTRFQVMQKSGSPPGLLVADSGHSHAAWRSIRGAIDASALDPTTRRHALGIFSLLAEAEAAVHGLDVEEVTFHEVGAWDSIADIVGAAALIAATDARRWTTSPAPLGSGRVDTAHGTLPVPAPATTRLLLGMQVLDDGIPGERVTPTGAAILRYLCGPAETRTPVAPVRTLVASGTGFGTRRLPGLSNHLRVLCFEPVPTPVVEHRRLRILEFDVDDQSGEDLASGLDRLRQYPAVLDLTQASVIGKKNRVSTLVRLLVRANELPAAVEGCFRETTTIGIRHYPAEGIALKRQTHVVQVDGHSLRVKTVERPGGRTAKAESDDVIGHADHGFRTALRRRAEALALAAEPAIADA